jgi:adenylate cyclase
MAPLIEKGGGIVEYRFRHRGGHYIWIQDTFSVTRDDKGRPLELVGSWADITDRKGIEAEVRRLADELEHRNRFIRDTFGRYLTDEVVATVLETPKGLQIGGEKRKITMMMADLRGFTSLSERLAPDRVLAILNRYLSAMVQVIKQYQGTIDEFIGDAIFVLFGAPIWHDDDAERAVACAVAMQLAMGSVNEQNRSEELPEVEMGIGINTGQVVVGNVGSPERMKYGVVGSQVNLTSRIQSCTTGGQILVSEATRREVGHILRIGNQMEIRAKGIEHPVVLSEILGMGGTHKLFLADASEVVVPLPEAVPFRYAVVEGDQVQRELLSGAFLKLSPKRAEARVESPLPTLSNLKMTIVGADGQEVTGALYGKIMGTLPGGGREVSIRFTSMAPEVKSALRGLIKKQASESVSAADPAHSGSQSKSA